MKHTYQLAIVTLESVCKAAQDLEDQGHEIMGVFPTMQAAPAQPSIATPGQPQMVPLMAMMIRKPREDAAIERPSMKEVMKELDGMTPVTGAEDVEGEQDA